MSKINAGPTKDTTNLAPKRRRIFLVYGGILLLGFVFGVAVHKFISTNSRDALVDAIRPLRQSNTAYLFTHPLLSYEVPESTVFDQYIPLKKELQNFIDSQIRDHKVYRVSLYFRNLNLGRWVGIHENDTYDPASLLKVPIMIAYYKYAEGHPWILDKQAVYSATANQLMKKENFAEHSTLKVGQTYSVAELIWSMITESDNGAKNLLLMTGEPRDDDFRSVFTDLGIILPAAESNYLISVKTYSLFFRVLYNATYLNPRFSEDALSLLSKATYADGLVAGIPSGTAVAHKFGEHIVRNSNGGAGGAELHDCGIIYHPQTPYLLCVMTTGPDSLNLSNTIKGLSRIVFDSVSADDAAGD